MNIRKKTQAAAAVLRQRLIFAKIADTTAIQCPFFRFLYDVIFNASKLQFRANPLYQGKEYNVPVVTEFVADWRLNSDSAIVALKEQMEGIWQRFVI